MLETFFEFIPALITATGVSVFLWSAHWILLKRNADLGNERKFPRHIILLLLSVGGLLAIIIALPITESSRNQLIGLIGILLSGIIAFSSTNIISNLMGGILLRITKPFRTGDFIRVGTYFGRVSERGLFDTEIQTEMRELISISNSYLINNPVTTTRSSGTIISASLSLGYDVHHSKIEPLLIKAAKECGLEDAFVHILELGNFSVTYRVSGMLTEIKHMLSVRSKLYLNILNILHNEDIEIMSPSFVNQRRLENEKKTIPVTVASVKKTEKEIRSEEIAFDKAEAAEKRELDILKTSQNIEALEASLKQADQNEKESIQKKVENLRKRLAVLQKQQQKDPDTTSSENKP